MVDDALVQFSLVAALAAGDYVGGAPLREVLTDGINSVLVEPGNAAALANALNGLANNPRLADRLARRAFADASLYSWDARAARLEPVLVEAGGRS